VGRLQRRATAQRHLGGIGRTVGDDDNVFHGRRNPDRENPGW
jgi:hypothetical protein